MATCPALQRAVDIAGGQTALAEKLQARGHDVKQGHIWYWLNKSGRVPAEAVLPIEAATGVSRHDLRPDLYPPPAEASTSPEKAA